MAPKRAKIQIFYNLNCKNKNVNSQQANSGQNTGPRILGDHRKATENATKDCRTRIQRVQSGKETKTSSHRG